MAGDDFELTDYELKVNFLAAHFGRMWTRFNFFLVFESGLLAAAVNASQRGARLGIACGAIVISIVWYVFGAEDKYLVETYRGEVRAASEALKSAGRTPAAYLHVGQVDRAAADQLHLKRGPLQWRFDRVSVTHLAPLFPALATVAWAVTAITLS